MKRKLIYSMLIIIVSIVTVVFFSIFQNIVPNNNILVTMAYDYNDKYQVSSINIKEESTNSDYLKLDGYDEIRFVNKTGIQIYCVGKKTDSNDYSLLVVEGNKTQEIMKLQNEIIFPTQWNNEIIFISGEKEMNFLYAYDLNSKSIKRLYDGNVDKYSRPIVNQDGSIIFVTNKKETNGTIHSNTDGNGIITFTESYKIKMLQKNGTIQELIEGRFPLWISSGSKLLFSKSGDLKVYDIKKNKISSLKKKIYLIETPSISPDGKYLAFFEYDYVGLFGSESTEFLSVMGVNGKSKIHVKEYNNSKKRLFPSGIEWIEAEP